jgi:CSLREA domain-containing protein
LFLLIAGGAQAAIVTVTTTSDDITPNDGSVSLREAIQAINAGNNLGDPDIIAENPGTFGVNDTIDFAIPQLVPAVQQTIQVGNTGNGALPALTKPVAINGYSEPGASANTLINADNAVVEIALDGANAGAGADGLLLALGSAGSTVQGLDIFDFSRNQVELQSGGDVVAGNSVGFDTSGSPTHSPIGVRISNASGNTVGGTTKAARNVISGNVGSGVEIIGTTALPATGNVVEGNFIGTDPTGTSANGNGRFGANAQVGAVQVSGGNANTIGGTTAFARNVISGNGSGVDIRNGGQNNVVQGNFIGVGADGVTPVPNTGFGVHVGSDDNLAPPAGPGQANEPAASGNIIGLNPTTLTGTGTGNLIEFNGGPGVLVAGTPQNNVTQRENSGNSVLANSIYANGGLGIALQQVAPNPKPNNLLNYPTITAVTPGASSTVIQGTLNLPSSPHMTVRIELFSSAACGASGFGQGQTFIGSVNATTDASGNASFSDANASTVLPGQSVTATATNTTADPSTPAGSVNVFNTSQFSRCVTVPTPTPTPTPTPAPTPPPATPAPVTPPPAVSTPPARPEMPAASTPSKAPEKAKAPERTAAATGKSASKAAAGGSYWVQVGAFKESKNAEGLAHTLRSEGFTVQVASVTRGEALHVVRVGGFADRGKATAAREELQGKGHSGFVTQGPAK